MFNKFNDADVLSLFNKPMIDALEKCRKTRRDCPELGDAEFLMSGTGRALDDVRSGRDWVQKGFSVFNLPLTVSRFFGNLRSPRRLSMLIDVNTNLRATADFLSPAKDDPFADCKEADGFAIYAADGHYHGASSHEELIEGSRQPVGHFFAINMRTHTALHLDVARPKKKREHDITALKRLDIALRMNEPKGKKVIIAYDPAVYDFSQWHKWKRARGIYIITMKKSNTELLYCGQNEFDKNDNRNAGVVSDKTGAPSGGEMLREIVYIDPVTNKKYEFLTNEMTLPPGLIVYIYKHRWDIEKLFDEFKNKLMERKAWAKTPTAKCAQANFICLAHNLMLLFERKIEETTGIVDVKIKKKSEKRAEEDLNKTVAAGRKPNALAIKPCRAIQRSMQFIRWLRNAFVVQASWLPAIEALRPLMAKYLT